MLLLIPFAASAQFYVTGDDPGKFKWSYIETNHFRIIYPNGTDSLAKVYGTDLEHFYTPLSRTSGYLPNGNFGKKMPVMIHAYNAANGSVAWAPNRMDLFTLPSAYDPEPLPWNKMLAIHEGRHVTQMQFGMTNAMKPGNYIFGQMWNIAVTLIYPGIAFMEGDAVVTETAYTPSGRGRTSDFLNYYRIAFDEGVERSWQQWRFPSQKNYSPSYYSLGYMAVGGLRYLYDIPELMNKGFDLASHRPYNLAAFRTNIKNLTGKRFKYAFKEICDTMAVIWKEEADARAPYIPSEPVTKKPRLYTEYHNGVFVGNDFYAVKKGHLTTPVLIKIDPFLREKTVLRFAADFGTMKKDGEGNLYWSESKSDPRWSLKTASTIQKLENGRKRSTRIGKAGLKYNPTPTENGDSIAVVEYSVNGGSTLNIIRNSDIADSFEAPDSLQLVETAWSKDAKYIYATAVSDNGYGIYRLDLFKRVWTVSLSPAPVMVKDFKSHGESLMFTCDRTGVNELYHFNPSTGKLTQTTSTRHGAEDFVYSPEGYYLYYSLNTLKGKQVFRTQVDSLINKTVDFAEVHKYVIAEKLTEQEQSLAAERHEAFVPDSTVTFSEPKRYRKISNMFNIHSWAPVYVNVDNIMNMSYDYIFQAASLGATAIMQNRLATGVGEFGYSAHKDPYDKSKWRHSGHFKFTYSGLYPVIEAKFDINDRAARQYNVKAIKSGEGASIGLYSGELAVPYMEGKLSAYIPFTFNSGGWYKGFIPKLTYRITNDMLNTSITVLEQNPSPMYPPVNAPFAGVIDGKNRFRHSLTGSLRGYTSLSTPNSAAYPRWGIGAEIGASANLESLDILSPMGYGYIYGYVPGITREQGLKLSVMHQQKLSDKSIFSTPLVSVLPRGLASNADLTTYMSIQNPAITRFSADYAIPVYIGDIAIAGGLVYIKRLCITPHADYMRAGKTDLISLGSALTLDLNGLIWIGWPVSVGVTYSYSGLADYNIVKSQTGIDMEPHHAGFVFNVSF